MPISQGLTRRQSINLYEDLIKDNDKENLRLFCRDDLFFLLVIALKRKDADDDWLYERIREVELEPNNVLDLWGRFHYKSTIKSYALIIQDILCSHGINPIKYDKELCILELSRTRPIANKFVDQVKTELEINVFLKDLFPDILYKEPKNESPCWSLERGIVVKRKSNPKEATLEAAGLLEGMPTGGHWDILNYDDIVTDESVSTPEQIHKTLKRLELSYAFTTPTGVKRFTGTFYDYGDAYHTIIKRGTVKTRIYPSTDDGTETGKPVFLSEEKISELRRDMGIYVFACQMLLDPRQQSIQRFKDEWLRYYDYPDFYGFNMYLICDPATRKKKENDYTVMIVIAAGPDKNYYLVDAIRDRLNLTERTDKLYSFHQKYHPLMTGYEEYGMQCDIEHIKYCRKEKKYSFEIMPLGGQLSKRSRILGGDSVQGLVPAFEQHRVYLPHQLIFKDYQGKTHDFVYEFVNDEYLKYPFSAHDDMLDCLARIKDPALMVQFPMGKEYENYDKSNDMAEMEFSVI